MCHTTDISIDGLSYELYLGGWKDFVFGVDKILECCEKSKQPPSIIIFPGSLKELNHYARKKGKYFTIISAQPAEVLYFHKARFMESGEGVIVLGSEPSFDGLIRANIRKFDKPDDLEPRYYNNECSVIGIPIKETRLPLVFRIAWWFRKLLKA